MFLKNWTSRVRVNMSQSQLLMCTKWGTWMDRQLLQQCSTVAVKSDGSNVFILHGFEKTTVVCKRYQISDSSMDLLHTCCGIVAWLPYFGGQRARLSQTFSVWLTSSMRQESPVGLSASMLPCTRCHLCSGWAQLLLTFWLTHLSPSCKTLTFRRRRQTSLLGFWLLSCSSKNINYYQQWCQLISGGRLQDTDTFSSHVFMRTD